MILQIENLCKSFGGIMAVNNVSFGVDEGEISSIIGPNGAGKSTLFNLMTGHLEKDAGKIIFKGEDISGLPPYKICRKRIGRSFQLVNLFLRMTVFDNIQTAILAGQGLGLKFMRSAESMRRNETQEVLQSIGLAGRASAYASDLSYGEQRRLELGIALANRPEIVFLDEPCAGLTDEETNTMVNLIQKLPEERGVTVLMVEHKMDVIFAISEKIRVLYEGKIIFEDVPEEVKKSDEVLRVYLGEQA